jgi:hypothetical protein
MAKIVAIHGIGQQRKGESTLRAAWLPALRDGLKRTGKEFQRDDDLVCAFYGDLFRPKGKSLDPPYDRSDVDNDWERALLYAWWEQAAQFEPEIPGPDVRTKASTPLSVQRALDALSHYKFFKPVAERALIFDLKQVDLYMNNPEIRAKIQERVAQTVHGDTTVFIGHSLGSIVAYEALCAHPEWPVRTLVTLGSPLGIRNLIFDYLRPPPVNGIGCWPGKVTNWTNISDAGDVVALVKALAGQFNQPGRADCTVCDVSISNGATAHNIEPYLTAEETGRAIASGL